MSDIRSYVDEQIAFAEERIKKELTVMIEEMKRELRISLNKSVEAKTQNNQLITLPEKTREEMTIACTKQATSQVFKVLRDEIIPKIDARLQYLDSQTLDGDEMVNQYRRRLHETVNQKPGPTAGLITGKVDKKSSSKLAQFQKDTLFFNDDD